MDQRRATKVTIADPQFKLLIARGTEWVTTGECSIDSTEDVRTHNRLTGEEEAAGWTLLFDGDELHDMRAFREEGFPSRGWHFEDGVLATEGGGPDLITSDQFENFEFSCEWMVAPGGNSGIIYLVTEDQQATYLTGPEMQILDNSRHPDGRNKSTQAGSLYAMIPCAHDVTRPAGEWNHAVVKKQGDRIEHWLNGFKVVEYEIGSDQFNELVAASKFSQWPSFAKNRKGHIALQAHGEAHVVPQHQGAPTRLSFCSNPPIPAPVQHRGAGGVRCRHRRPIPMRTSADATARPRCTYQPCLAKTDPARAPSAIPLLRTTYGALDARPAAHPLVDDHSTAGDESVIRTLSGRSDAELFGFSIRNVGDLDADGVEDIVVAATRRVHDRGEGAVIAYSSATGDVLWEFEAPAAPTSLGVGLAPIGDIDADAVPDVLAGAPRHDHAYAISGRDGSLIHAITLGERGDRFGQKVSGMFDVDDDGIPELLIGAPAPRSSGAASPTSSPAPTPGSWRPSMSTHKTSASGWASPAITPAHAGSSPSAPLMAVREKAVSSACTPGATAGRICFALLKAAQQASPSAATTWAPSATWTATASSTSTPAITPTPPMAPALAAPSSSPAEVDTSFAISAAQSPARNSGRRTHTPATSTRTAATTL